MNEHKYTRDRGTVFAVLFGAAPRLIFFSFFLSLCRVVGIGLSGLVSFGILGGGLGSLGGLFDSLVAFFVDIPDQTRHNAEMSADRSEVRRTSILESVVVIHPQDLSEIDVAMLDVDDAIDSATTFVV